MSTALTSPEAHNAKRRAMQARWRRLRLIPLAIGALSMAVALWLGLVRLGLPLPGGTPPIAEYHGALMVGGFLGTLICLERAVALGRPWAYLAPALSSLGAVALLAGMPRLGALGFFAAAVFLLFASASIAIRQFALFTIVLAGGAACWLVGTLQWLTGYSMSSVVGWWLSFLILTIAAERLELSRLARPPPWSQATFAVALLLLLIGVARGEPAEPRSTFMAMGLMGCAAWLLHYDIARRTVRQSGQTRFSAVCLLAGHAWLGVAGVLLLINPPGIAVLSYDAAVHAIAIGFVLSMIFGHAPIILPAVTGFRVRYHSLAYVSLALLHASVMLRVTSDVFEWMDLRAASGIVTVLALAGYAATLFLTSRKGFSQHTA
jgi:hypothetical protein